MLYIKIGDNKYQAEFQSFITQFGNEGIRVISKAPITSGFLIIDDDDNIVSDKSDFSYLYREDGDCKEYTMVAETIIPTRCYMTEVPSSEYSKLSSRINKLSSAINATINSLEETNDAFCEYTTDTDIRLGDVEDSLCELSEMEESEE